MSLGKRSCMLSDYGYRRYLGQCSSRFWAGRSNGTVCHLHSSAITSNTPSRLEQVQPSFIFSVDAVVYVDITIAITSSGYNLCPAIITRCINIYQNSLHYFQGCPTNSPLQKSLSYIPSLKRPVRPGNLTG